MSALAVISTNDSGFADISSEVINPAGQSEQYADGVVQPEWLQNCHANQNKFRDDIASKKTELNEALTSAGDDKEKLSAFIVNAHNAVIQSSISGLLSAIAAGEAANKLKGMLAHGTWTAQLSKICSECGCGMSTMGKYMLLAQTPDAQDYAQLGISQVYQLCLIRNFVCREAKIEMNLAELLSRYGNLIRGGRGKLDSLLSCSPQRRRTVFDVKETEFFSGVQGESSARCSFRRVNFGRAGR